MQKSYLGESIRSIVSKNSFILLCLAVGILLRNVSSFFTLFSFIIIVAKHLSERQIAVQFDGVLFLLLLSVGLFVWTGLSTGLVTVHNAQWIAILSLLSYIVGIGFSNRFRDATDLYFLLFFLAFLLAIPNITVTLYDVFVNGLINPERDLEVLGDSQRHTTGRTVELSLAIAGIFMLFVRPLNKAESKIRLFFIIISVIAELCVLHYVSRTGAFLFIIAIIFGWLFGSDRRYSIIQLIVFAVLFYLFFMDSSLIDVYSNREIEGSTISNAGGRTERWQLGLAMLFANPSGYVYNNDYWYAHNFWLDFGREGGLYAFLSLSFFSVVVLWKTIILVKNKVFPTYLSKSLLCISFIFVITLFTEAVHTGAPLLMYVYYIFAGIICGNVRHPKRRVT